MLSKLKNNKGFTIIEVLIVLAIAGLIMLVVFLAVPALQRNQRNTARISDASLLASAINECLSNRNGQATSCDTTAKLNLDLTKFNQLTSINPGTTVPANTTSANFGFNLKCATDGSGPGGANPTTRSFVVLYQTESANANVPRCLEG